jgi:hypothetical protein
MEGNIIRISEFKQKLKTDYLLNLNNLSQALWPIEESFLNYKYEVSDLLIPTEEYADSYVDDYCRKNKDYFEKIENEKTDQQKTDLMTIEPSNVLIQEAQINIANIKKSSLMAILKSSKCSLINKKVLLSSDAGENIKTSLASIFSPIEKNSMNPKIIPSIETHQTNQNYLFLQISIHSSVSQKKISEILIRSDCLFSEFFENIECQISRIDKIKYNRFICLENILVTENDPQKKLLNADFVSKRMRMYKNNFELISSTEITFEDIEIILDKVYIYRDNVGCDHMIVFTDLLLGNLTNIEELNSKIALRFIPAYRSRICDVCQKQKAKFIAKGAEINHKKVNFMCERCNFDLNFNDAIVENLKQFELADYIFEEK